jgi:hypothetical protein
MNEIKEMMQNMAAEEKRRYLRYSGESLIVSAAGKLLEVKDIGLGGIRLAGQVGAVDDKIAITIFPRQGSKMDLNHGIKVVSRVKRVGDDDTALEFVSSTMALSKFIIGKIAEQYALNPYFVK